MGPETQHFGTAICSITSPTKHGKEMRKASNNLEDFYVELMVQNLDFK